VFLRGSIKVDVSLPPEVGTPIEEPLKIEASSSPPGGDLTVDYVPSSEQLELKMSSDDLSTLRAMLNSYLGLVSAAVRTASK
jgi:tRNA threonylcarbamoyladenosine modification (KEOPS) complex  Pcc1 subunit